MPQGKDQLRIVVSKLNSEPFCRNLRLVDLDRQSAVDRIEILNDVFKKLGFDVADDELYKERKEERVQRLLKQLAYLKDERTPTVTTISSSSHTLHSVIEGFDSLAAFKSCEQWLDALGEGKRDVVFDIIHWILSDFDRLSKRAYLSNYLAPFSLPGEVIDRANSAQLGFSGESYRSLTGQESEYQEQQETFQQVYTEYERLKEQNAKLNDCRSRTRLLEREEEQSEEKIQQLRKSAIERKGFNELLQASSLLRKAEENKNQLTAIMADQKRAIRKAQQNFEDKQRQLQELQKNVATRTTVGISCGIIFDVIEKDVETKLRTLFSTLIPTRDQLEKQLNELVQMKAKPLPTIDDIGHFKNLAANLEGEIREKTREIESLEGRQDNTHLQLYRQQTRLYVEQVSLKENEIKTKQQEKKNFSIVFQQLKSKFGQNVPSNIGWDSDENLLPSQQKDVDPCQRSKSSFMALQNEIAVLKKTEETLRSRLNQLELDLNSREVRAGLQGYRGMKDKLGKSSEQTAQLDLEKSQTLNEISTIIQQIVNELEEKKSIIKPLMKTLQDSRRKFLEVLANHSKSKERYEKYQLGYLTDLKDLKDRCDFFGNEMLAMDRRYHYLNTLFRIGMINFERVQLEERCRSNNECFLPEFPSIGDLYQNKLLQQESLAKQLRYREKELKKNEHEFIRQKVLFTDLHKFLECKLFSTKTKGTLTTQKQLLVEIGVLDSGASEGILYL